MEYLKVEDIAKHLEILNSYDISINSICTDTRKITSGCLFIAIEGENFDGHKYIDKAFDMGAKIVIAHKNIYTGDKPVLYVKNTRQAYLSLSNYYRNFLNTIIVGVTGSVGKTTTKDFIHSVLDKSHKTLKTQGNLNNEIGVPHTIFNLDKSFKYGVIEMGMSNLSEISNLSKACNPNLAVITNIGLSHIENLKSKENVLKAKLEILDGMSDDSIIFMNGDDELLFSCKKYVKNPILYYGLENTDVDIFGRNVINKGFNSCFEIIYNGDSYQANIPCLGNHNISNSLAAFGVGKILNLSDFSILSGLRNYVPSNMRQEIYMSREVIFIKDCYNANPDSMIASLKVLDLLEVAGKKIAVLGDMLELGNVSDTCHFNVGEYINNFDLDYLFCYGKYSKNIMLGAKANGFERCFHFSDKDSLFNKLSSTLQSGDAVLFKASRGIQLEDIVDKINRECF